MKYGSSLLMGVGLRGAPCKGLTPPEVLTGGLPDVTLLEVSWEWGDLSILSRRGRRPSPSSVNDLPGLG